MKAGPAKTVLLSFAKAAGTLGALSGTARMPDGRWYNVPQTMHGMDYVALWTGHYERAESDILKSDFKPDHTIIEIGSNIGVVSRVAAETKLQQGGTIVCVEANPNAIPYLESNLAKTRENNFSGRIEIIAAAVGAPTIEGEEQVFFQRNNLSSGLGSVLKTSRRGENIVQVPVRSLSSIVNDHAANGYSLICDAEGAEILILEKDARALQDCRQIAIELHHPRITGKDITPEDMIASFEKIGFERRNTQRDTHYFARPGF